MENINLNRGWDLFEAPLSWTRDMAGQVARQEEGWLDKINLPCDVHMPLIDRGIIDDPVIADNCFAAEWVEKRSWWFRKKFTVDSCLLARQVAELTIESLDVHGDIFINGSWIGHHASAHYPFRQDIRPWLQEGDNELLIRLTCGLEQVSDQDLSEIDYAVCTEANNNCPERGDKRRAFVRKPAYVIGWDWCPRIVTCGITKNVRLSFADKTAIREVHVYTKSLTENADGNIEAVMQIELGVELLDIIRSAAASLKVEITQAKQLIAQYEIDNLFLKSGINFFKLELTIEQAQLWWPNGMGQQPLYELEAEVNCGGESSQHPPITFAVRTIRLATDKIDAKTDDFVLIVNGRKVFCKGANWIPADSLYARVSDSKYRQLVSEARNAHFNMLRIWGGGLYERDIFYDECDSSGILVWHDFMFGCATYPDHREQFYDLVRKEIDYQTKRLRNHACLALFCGNNENHWLFTGPGFADTVDIKQSKQYGLKISNVLCPEIIHNNCPEIPYWNSSPYGGDEPNSPDSGDVHHWHACMMNPQMEKRIDPREYDLIKARFVSEYGYPGPCVRQTVEDYFGEHPVERNSPIWNLHNNTFEKYTVQAGIARHYLDKNLDLDEYLLYAGLTQAHMLGYSLEAIRYKTFCNGALFWMYNDCWGEVGWTIVDYYLRRKISYYAVRRAFWPQKLILRHESDGRIHVTGCNDTPADLALDIAYGFVSLDGKSRNEAKTRITLKACSRSQVLSFTAPVSRTDIICYVRPLQDSNLLPGILSFHDMRQLDYVKPEAVIEETWRDGADLMVQIRAKTFCHAIHLKTDRDYSLSDNYFDLLPAENRLIRIENGAECKPELLLIDLEK